MASSRLILIALLSLAAANAHLRGSESTGQTVQGAEGEGSAAERAGVRVGDLIVRVDGVSLAGLDRREARGTFLGEEGTEVTLGIVGLDGEEREVRVTREERTDPSVRHPHFVDSELKIAYLAITSFTTETPAEFGFALTALGEVGMQGLILDLRGNPGGILKSAVEIAEHFIPVVQDVQERVWSGVRLCSTTLGWRSRRSSRSPLPSLGACSRGRWRAVPRIRFLFSG